MKRRRVMTCIICAIVIIMSTVALFLVLDTENKITLENIEEQKNKDSMDGTYYEVKGVNSPKITEAMIPVYWDDNGNEIEYNSDNFVYDNWYDYSQDKWANAKTKDGSYWVWIPRYAYCLDTDNNIKIEYLRNLSLLSSNSEITFVNELGKDNWNIHPAFSYVDSENLLQLSGIWVAKYEMGYENNSGKEFELNNIFNQNVNLVSKPDVPAWTLISIDNVYLNSILYDNTKNSHLIKNTEWSAMVYLEYANELQENLYSVQGLNNDIEEFVSAYLKNAELFNSTEFVNGEPKYLDIYENKVNKYGDGIIETKAINTKSSEFLTNAKPYLVRTNSFGYTNCSGLPHENRGFRIVLW